MTVLIYLVDLIAVRARRWSRISQDDCGSRGAAEGAFGAAMLRGPGGGWKAHVVLDRCSPDAADRKAWLQLALVGKRDKGE